MWLLQAAVTPLGAANAKDLEQIGSADAEQAPYYVEKVGSGAANAKKSPLLPIMIGVAAAAVVAAVLILVVFKTSYDITGEWTMNYSIPGLSPATYPVTFTGDKKAGTALMNNVNGDYAVDGKKVTINLYQNQNKWEFIGEFKAKNRIEGDFKFYTDNVLKPQYNTTFYADKK
jgi:hypothetical protein